MSKPWTPWNDLFEIWMGLRECFYMTYRVVLVVCLL